MKLIDVTKQFAAEDACLDYLEPNTHSENEQS
jgi:hypothetical protein